MTTNRRGELLSESPRRLWWRHSTHPETDQPAHHRTHELTAVHGRLKATHSISTLQSTTMLDTTHARAGGFAPKYSRNTLLNDWKSRGSSSHTPQRTTCSGP